VAAARIPRRIGFDASRGAWLFHERVHRDPARHDVERNLALLEPFGGWAEPPNLHVPVQPEAVERAAALVPPDDRPLVVMAPGSVWATKRWTAGGFAVVARRLGEAGARVVLIGGAGRRRRRGACGGAHGGHAHPLAGRTDLATSVALIDRAAVLVGNDSAPMHIAGARGVPVVAVFCATTPALGYGPWGHARACRRRRSRVPAMRAARWSHLPARHRGLYATRRAGARPRGRATIWRRTSPHDDATGAEPRRPSCCRHAAERASWPRSPRSIGSIGGSCSHSTTTDLHGPLPPDVVQVASATRLDELDTDWILLLGEEERIAPEDVPRIRDAIASATPGEVLALGVVTVALDLRVRLGRPVPRLAPRGTSLRIGPGFDVVFLCAARARPLDVTIARSRGATLTDAVELAGADAAMFARSSIAVPGAGAASCGTRWWRRRARSVPVRSTGGSAWALDPRRPRGLPRGGRIREALGAAAQTRRGARMTVPRATRRSRSARGAPSCATTSFRSWAPGCSPGRSRHRPMRRRSTGGAAAHSGFACGEASAASSGSGGGVEPSLT
jgi:hypothetical protein